ncbi:MAG: fumarylacetoacetate hydrolase family protein [Acidimicrobiia bacterium]|nr:fumarylacetoacetate hydrolase family protein [Acidimicrobiia bacterium]
MKSLPCRTEAESTSCHHSSISLYRVVFSTTWANLIGLFTACSPSARACRPPQFSLGKSRRGYSPFGPWLVDAHTLANRDNVTVSCTVNGIEKQRGSTDDLIFDVPTLVAYLSSIVELLPGDVIFTGTPSGVGGARKPPEFLKPGDVVMSTLHGVASITNRCV